MEGGAAAGPLGGAGAHATVHFAADGGEVYDEELGAGALGMDEEQGGPSAAAGAAGAGRGRGGEEEEEEERALHAEDDMEEELIDGNIQVRGEVWRSVGCVGGGWHNATGILPRHMQGECTCAFALTSPATVL